MLRMRVGSPTWLLSSKLWTEFEEWELDHHGKEWEVTYACQHRQKLNYHFGSLASEPSCLPVILVANTTDKLMLVVVLGCNIFPGCQLSCLLSSDTQLLRGWEKGVMGLLISGYTININF